MSDLVLNLPIRPDQKAFNLLRWEELQGDTSFQGFEGRVETDRHGHVIMSPPATRFHGNFQFRIAQALHRFLAEGEVITECPVSTGDGVKVADVGWLSKKRSAETAGQSCLEIAPEICVEVISPSNTEAEMREKIALYFAAGAEEVWRCQAGGRMSFLVSPEEEAERSVLCPEFPKKLQD